MGPVFFPNKSSSTMDLSKPKSSLLREVYTNDVKYVSDSSEEMNHKYS